MIPATAAQSAINAALQLDVNNLRASPKAGTPLRSLVDASCLPIGSPMVAGGAIDTAAVMNAEYQPDAGSIEAESRIPCATSEAMSQHDELMDELVTEISPLVANHLAFAKNIAKPAIQQFVETVSGVLAGFPEQVTYNPELVKVDLPAPAQMSQLESEYSKYNSSPYAPIPTAVRLPVLSEEGVMELLRTGSAALDAAIELWKQAEGPGFFVNVYHVVFCASAPGITMTPEQLLQDRISGSSAATAAFLMARKLLEAPPEGASYGLSEYRILMGGLVEQLAVRLVSASSERARNIEQGRLILLSEPNRVVVFAPVYNEWIENGGNNGVLFGSTLKAGSGYSVHAMTEGAASFLTTWEQHNRLLTTSQRLRRNEIVRDTLRDAVRTVAATNAVLFYGDVYGITADNPTHAKIDEHIYWAHNYIAFLKEDKLKDLWSIGVEVVAGQLLGFTDAAVILRGIEQACKDNEGIPVEEAALLSLVAYTTNFIVDQIEVRGF